MPDRLPGLCYYCAHWHGKTEGRSTCDAFPAGVSVTFTWGGALHFDPVPGDHGIQFEPAEGVSSEDLARFHKRARKTQKGAARRSQAEEKHRRYVELTAELRALAEEDA